jgi:hypothetical protein
MNELFLEVSTEIEVGEDLCKVRILVSYKHMAEQNLFGRFDPIINFGRGRSRLVALLE